MKVALVANSCWNIYNFRKGLVHHFLKKGDEVIVLAPKDEYSDKISDWGLRWIDTPLQGTGTNPIKDFSYFRRVRDIFRKERPDVALAYTIKSNIYASLAGSFTKTPVICNVSGLGTVFLVKGFTGKVAMNLYRLAFRRSSFVFFQNKDDRDLFLSHVPIPDNRIGLVPGSGIDLDQFTVTTQPNNAQINFLMIARVIVEKGVREFAEAAQEFKDDNRLKFTLVGRLDEGHARSISKSELDTWISEGSLEYLPHSDQIKELIVQSDALVLPSYREGTPRTLLEGAAMGRPLLTTRVPGCQEVVKDGINGFLFEVKDAKSLAQKIRLFMALDHTERQEMGANSRRLAKEVFDEKKVIDIYDQTIRRIIRPA